MMKFLQGPGADRAVSARYGAARRVSREAPLSAAQAAALASYDASAPRSSEAPATQRSAAPTTLGGFRVERKAPSRKFVGWRVP